MPFTQTSESFFTKIRSLRVPPAALIGAAVLAAICVAAVAFGPLSSGTPSFVVPGDAVEESHEGSKKDEAGAAADSSSVEDSNSTNTEPQNPVTYVTVHVAGSVAEPGIYSMPEGSRVQDAVDAAGGFSKDAAPDAVNLARVLQEGEQVAIPAKEQVRQGSVSTGAAQASGAATSTATAIVNINTAGAEELDTLPGVGPATAQAIIEERESGGPFASIEDIQRVSGIGEKKFEKLKDSICV